MYMKLGRWQVDEAAGYLKDKAKDFLKPYAESG